jgi:hypothetical protein
MTPVSPDKAEIAEFNPSPAGLLGRSFMNTQPHRNEDRFYRYPKHRVVAIIDDDQLLETAVKHLDDAGIDLDTVHVLSGPDGARLLDRSGRRHGFGARLLRIAQGGAFETDVLRAHEAALNDGRHVLFVPASGADARKTVADILRAAGGHGLLYFGTWTIGELRS